MGLDMYLSRRTYVKRWNHEKLCDRHEVTVSRGGKLVTQINPDRITYVTEEIAYWRKANQIHKWFVDNVQNGQDDCREYHVPLEKLRTLIDTCKSVLAFAETVDGMLKNGVTYYPDGTIVTNTVPGKVVTNQKMVSDLLPTTTGFFFGSSAYDEFYLHDIEITIKQIEPVLDDDIGSFLYQSSW